jgi:archaellum component FlaF (FlaF/FlaG flagellin family)
MAHHRLRINKRGVSIALSTIILAWIILSIIIFLTAYESRIITYQKLSLTLLSDNALRKNELVFGSATAQKYYYSYTLTIKFSNNGTSIVNVVSVLILGTTQRNYIPFTMQMLPNDSYSFTMTIYYQPIDVIIITSAGGTYHLPLKIIVQGV